MDIVRLMYSSRKRRLRFVRDLMRYNELCKDYAPDSSDDEKESSVGELNIDESESDVNVENEPSKGVKKNTGKRKRSEYHEFVSIHLSSVRTSNPGMSHGEAIRVVAQMWREVKDGRDDLSGRSLIARDRYAFG